MPRKSTAAGEPPRVTERVALRLSDDESAHYTAVAAEEGVPLSTYLRQALRGAHGRGRNVGKEHPFPSAKRSTKKGHDHVEEKEEP